MKGWLSSELPDIFPGISGGPLFVGMYFTWFYYHLVIWCFVFAKHLEVYLDSVDDGKGLQVNKVIYGGTSKNGRGYF